MIEELIVDPMTLHMSNWMGGNRMKSLFLGSYCKEIDYWIFIWTNFSALKKKIFT